MSDAVPPAPAAPLSAPASLPPPTAVAPAATVSPPAPVSLPEPPLPELPRWDADLVFAALGDPVRRRILQALASGKPRTATDLKGCARRKLDATLKHLIALRESGLVQARQNPTDGRRQLYILSPDIKVTQPTPGKWEMDFGLCVVRIVT